MVRCFVQVSTPKRKETGFDWYFDSQGLLTDELCSLH